MFVTCGVIFYDFVLTLKLCLFLCDIYICCMFSFGKIFLDLITVVQTSALTGAQIHRDSIPIKLAKKKHRKLKNSLL